MEYTTDYRTRYGKPVVWDEIAYEGNIDMGWGNISGQELTRRFWEASMRGGYAGHGETFIDEENDILWWSHGGELHGESPARIKFLHEILCQTPGLGLREGNSIFDEVVAVPDSLHPPGGVRNPLLRALAGRSFRNFHKEEGVSWRVEVIGHLGDDSHRPGRVLRQLPGASAWEGVYGHPFDESIRGEKGATSHAQAGGSPFLLPLGIRKSLNARLRPDSFWVGYTLSMPPQTRAQCYKKKPAERELLTAGVVGESGFEPLKSSTTDLQSAPFGHSGTLPYKPLPVWLGMSMRLRLSASELVNGLEPLTC